MPRGVPGSGKARVPSTKTGAPQTAAVAPAAATPISAQALEVEQGNHPSDVDRMGGDHLRTYAKRCGVTPRDVDSLLDDKLRQACKVMLALRYEDD